MPTTDTVNDSSIYVFVTLLAVFVGAALLYISTGLFVSRRRTCPGCGNKSLRCVQWIRATVLIGGKKTPDTRSYYLCESCGARLKKNPDASFTQPSEAEWRQYCSSKW